jgi:hypothetical protein
MSKDVARKLAFLFERHRVTPDQFIEEFADVYGTPRRSHIREWLAGNRSPHGTSLNHLAGYWSQRAPGIERFWWHSPFEEFVDLYNFSSKQKKGAEDTLRPAFDKMGQWARKFSDRERNALCGVYRTYRRSFGDIDQVAVEILEISANAEDNVAANIYTTSHATAGNRLTRFEGQVYRLKDQFWVQAFLAHSAEALVRHVYLSMHTFGRMKFGMVAGVTERRQMPAVARVVLTRIEPGVVNGEILQTVRRSPFSDIPEECRRNLLSDFSVTQSLPDMLQASPLKGD